MRRALFVAGGIALAAAVAQAARHRRGKQLELEPAPDPAEELRRTLESSREDAGAEPEGDRPSLEERRARVHGKAQEAIDLMREQNGG
jgi:hypothetical protein